jgi:hypothetical protein
MTKINNFDDLNQFRGSGSASSQGTPFVSSGTTLRAVEVIPKEPASTTPAPRKIKPADVMNELEKAKDGLNTNPHDKSGAWRKTKIMDASSDEVLSVLDQFKIHLDKRPPYHPPVMKCMDMGLGGYGNFGIITGQLKSGKSHVIAAMVAAYLFGEKSKVLNFASQPDAKRPDVLYFDTEMDADDVWKQHERISHFKALQGAEFGGTVHMYPLRRFTPSERLKMIDTAIEHYHHTCGLVIIDGIRDLIYDINSVDETMQITSDVMRWTDEHKVHIITALHQNKSTNTGQANNMRGHLGTEFGNKAQYVIECKKTGSGADAFFTVEPPANSSRSSAGFEAFGYQIESYEIESGGYGSIPLLMDGTDFVMKKQGGERSAKSSKHSDVMPSEFQDEVHFNLIRKVFEKADRLRYADLKDLILNSYFDVTGKDKMLSDNRARLWISYWMQNEWITSIGKAGTRTCFYLKSDEIV